MNTASIFIKTEPKIKKEAQKTAAELGFSLSSILNAYLREFVKTKKVSFSAHPLDETLNAQTRALLKQSEGDVKAGRVSPTFTNVKDAIAWLDDPDAKDKNGNKVHDTI